MLLNVYIRCMILDQHLETAIYRTRETSLSAAYTWRLPLGHVTFDLTSRVSINHQYLRMGTHLKLEYEEVYTCLLLSTCDAGGNFSTDIWRLCASGHLRSDVVPRRESPESMIAQIGRAHFNS